jgi:hypothetical protein
MVRLEPPKHVGHLFQYVRTLAAVTQVVLSVVILVKVSG